MLTRTCPHCNCEVQRIPKTGISKFLGKFLEIHKYQCQNTKCKWEKLAFPELKQKYIFKLLFPYLITIGMPLILIIIFLIFSIPQQPDQSIPTSPSINSTPVVKDVN